MEIREQIRLVNAALSGTMDLYRIWAKRCHVSYNALLVLYTLEDLKVCTQKQICTWWALPKQTVHGILLELEKKGYVTLAENKENKRERLVTFTEEGKALAASLLTPLHAMEEGAMEQLGEETRRRLIACNTQYYERPKAEMTNGTHTG